MKVIERTVTRHAPEPVKDVLRPFYHMKQKYKYKIKYYYSHLKHGDMLIQTPFGFEMYIDMADHVQRRYIDWSENEEELVLLRNLVNETEGAFIDIGANVGFHSMYFKSIDKNNREVFAFEPLSYNIERMKENIALNNIDNIRIFSYGLSDENSEYYLKYKKTNRGEASTARSGPEEKELSEFKQLDDVEEIKSSNLGIVKLDVEGKEMDVINGAKNCLDKDMPTLLIEIHPNKLKKKISLFETCVQSLFH